MCVRQVKSVHLGPGPVVERPGVKVVPQETGEVDKAEPPGD